jgi:hypothetical protein
VTAGQDTYWISHVDRAFKRLHERAAKWGKVASTSVWLLHFATSLLLVFFAVASHFSASGVPFLVGFFDRKAARRLQQAALKSTPVM